MHGTRGRIVLHYRLGRVRLERDGRSEVREHPATDLLENLAAHVLDPPVPLLVPLASARAFMQVVEAVRLAPDPVEIPIQSSRVEETGEFPRHVVPGSANAVVRAADQLALLSELELPWAQPSATVRG